MDECSGCSGGLNAEVSRESGGLTFFYAQGERDEVFRQLIMKNCKEHYKCAQCVADYIKNTYQKNLSDEELIYLTRQSITRSLQSSTMRSSIMA